MNSLNSNVSTVYFINGKFQITKTDRKSNGNWTTKEEYESELKKKYFISKELLAKQVVKDSGICATP